jgi:hypothetical protein
LPHCKANKQATMKLAHATETTQAQADQTLTLPIDRHLVIRVHERIVVVCAVDVAFPVPGWKARLQPPHYTDRVASPVVAFKDLNQSNKVQEHIESSVQNKPHYTQADRDFVSVVVRCSIVPAREALRMHPVSVIKRADVPTHPDALPRVAAPLAPRDLGRKFQQRAAALDWEQTLVLLPLR